MSLPYVDVKSMSKELGKQPWEIDSSRLPNIWGMSAPWLLSRGYKIYNAEPEWGNESTFCSPDTLAPRDLPHPYAFSAYTTTRKFREICFQQNLVGAQDKQQRDVIIKAVPNGSQELTIFKLLAETPDLLNVQRFPSVMPVLDLLDTPYDYTFVVMPRWGSTVRSFSTIGEFLFFVSSLLRGLSFLHELRIAHRDISSTNYLMNYFEYNSPAGIYDHPDLVPFRAGQMLLSPQYCLFDFNLSVIFPRSAPLHICRLPAELSSCGAPRYHPPDLQQGELDYDPFAFDVGCMGQFFLQCFHYMVPAIPFFAPLLECLITDNVEHRFTADEALRFFEDNRSMMSAEELAKEPPCDNPYPLTIVPWESLPLTFAEKWSFCRNPPTAFWTRVLRWVNATSTGHGIIQSVRKVILRWTSSPTAYIFGHWELTG